MFDVIVAGGGPAGAVAATVLARGGARVLVVDRAAFPRDKLCGDTINPGTVALLRRLRLLERFERAALPIEGMVVSGERGVRLQCAYDGGMRGLAIQRRDLDAALAEGAVAAGARFEERVLVRGPLVDRSGSDVRVRGVVIAGRDGRDLRVPSPIVIAADGRRSRLAVPLGLARHPRGPRRWAVGAYFQDVEGMTAFGEMHVRRGRYLGVAPLPSGLANVCVVTPDRTGLADPGTLLREAVSADAATRERFARARLVTRPMLIGPLAVDAVGAGLQGLLLAGDAAGFIDPMTGDGLRFAVRGGELAAEVALAALAGRLAVPHAVLARVRRREFAAKWRFDRALRGLVDRSLAIDVAGAVAAAAPWILRRTIAFAGDVPDGRQSADAEGR